MADPKNLSERVRRLRLPVAHLADRAGLHLDTVHGVLRGVRDPRMGTARRIEAAIVAEEKALLAHLLALHPSVVGETLPLAAE